MSNTGDAVVHIFLPPQREFYNLEEFYANATSIDLPFEDEKPFRQWKTHLILWQTYDRWNPEPFCGLQGSNPVHGVFDSMVPPSSDMCLIWARSHYQFVPYWCCLIEVEKTYVQLSGSATITLSVVKVGPLGYKIVGL